MISLCVILWNRHTCIFGSKLIWIQDYNVDFMIECPFYLWQHTTHFYVFVDTDSSWPVSWSHLPRSLHNHESRLVFILFLWPQEPIAHKYVTFCLLIITWHQLLTGWNNNLLHRIFISHYLLNIISYVITKHIVFFLVLLEVKFLIWKLSLFEAAKFEIVKLPTLGLAQWGRVIFLNQILLFWFVQNEKRVRFNFFHKF